MAISSQEFERRHQGIRDAMKKEGIDALVISGRDEIFSRGHIRYVADFGASGYIVFPLEGKPIYHVHPVYAASPKTGRGFALRDYVDIRTHVDGAYGRDPAANVLSALAEYDGDGRIGLVGPNDIGIAVYKAVNERYGDRLVDATHILRNERLVKSEEMLASMWTSAQIADEVGTMLIEMARPGVTDYEIYGAVKKHIYDRGCEYSFEVIDAEGAAFNFTGYPLGGTLEDGGTLFMEVTPAYNGVFAQLPFSLLIGSPGRDLLAMKDAWKAGFERGEAMLRPGTRVGDLSKAMKETINGLGYATPYAQGHAIGLDVVDGWPIGDAIDVVLEPGMTMALHPCATVSPGGDGYTSGYTYVITEDGAERLSSHDFTQ